VESDGFGQLTALLSRCVRSVLFALA